MTVLRRLYDYLVRIRKTPTHAEFAFELGQHNLARLDQLQVLVHELKLQQDLHAQSTLELIAQYSERQEPAPSEVPSIIDDIRNSQLQSQSQWNHSQNLLQQISSSLNKQKAALPTRVLYANDQEIVVETGGYFLIFPISQLNHALSFLNPKFDFGMRSYIANNVKPGDTFIDIGANAGVMAAIGARSAGPQGRVITVEPIPDLADFSKRNVFLNAVGVPHQHFAKAITKNASPITLQVCKTDTRISTLFAYDESAPIEFESVTVEGLRLQSIIPDTGNLVIKIDAEGTEAEILDQLFAMTSCLVGRSVHVIFEFSAEHLERAGTIPQKLFDKLQSRQISAHFIDVFTGVKTQEFGPATFSQIGNVVFEWTPDATPDSTPIPQELFKSELDAILQRPLLDSFHCPCCNSPIELSALDPIYHECMFTQLQLERYECHECHLVFGPVPLITATSEELGSLYTLLYQFFQEGASTPFQEKTFYLLNPERSGNYLNYACGDWPRGLSHLRDSGWNVWGFEPFQNVAHEHIIHETSRLVGRRFDGLFSHNYLEHVQHPQEFFQTCHELIEPNGIMAHSTPCYDYVFAQAPLHLYFFCEHSVERLASRTGFEVISEHRSDHDEPGAMYTCKVFQKKSSPTN